MAFAPMANLSLSGTADRVPLVWQFGDEEVRICLGKGCCHSLSVPGNQQHRRHRCARLLLY